MRPRKAIWGQFATMRDARCRMRDVPHIDPSSTCQVLLAAGKHLVIAGRPLLYADSGVENVNSAVDGPLFSGCLERILAQVEVAFSNSLIEAYWRSLKHQWLFLNTFPSWRDNSSLISTAPPLRTRSSQCLRSQLCSTRDRTPRRCAHRGSRRSKRSRCLRTWRPAERPGQHRR